jgi:hypothetical protein
MRSLLLRCSIRVITRHHEGNRTIVAIVAIAVVLIKNRVVLIIPSIPRLSCEKPARSSRKDTVRAHDFMRVHVRHQSLYRLVDLGEHIIHSKKNCNVVVRAI